MIIFCDQAWKLSLMVVGAVALSGCSTLDIKPSDHPDFVFQPRPVETIGETISREQQGEDGCLVAGNLNKGKSCRDLTKLLTPRARPDEP